MTLPQASKLSLLGIPWRSRGRTAGFTAVGWGSIVGQGIKIPQDLLYGQKKKKKKDSLLIEVQLKAA